MPLLASTRRLSTADPAAEAAFEHAATRFAAHKPLVCEAIAECLDADPFCLSALAFDGFVQVLLARSETREVARRRYAEVLEAARQIEPTPFESALIEALSFAVEGWLLKAARRLEAQLETDPVDFVSFKLAHALRFVAGDAHGMLAVTTGILPAWTGDEPFYGYLLGCHAFSLGENGYLAEADATGRRAVEFAPDDAWGLHAVAHVMETRGMARTGIAWLEAARPVWKSCNNFGFHMAWHLALFHLEIGSTPEVYRLYDEEVRPVGTDDFRDIANAASMLWRMQQHGLDVGSRWDELHAIARRRADDTSLVFASLHHLLTFIACDDRIGAARLVANLEALARRGVGDQAQAAALAGVPLAQLLRARDKAAISQMHPVEVARILPCIGGSQAQRDVFLRSLALQGAAAGDAKTAREVLAARGAGRAPDRISNAISAMLAAHASALQKHVA